MAIQTTRSTDKTAKPFDVRYIENPTQAELRALALEYTPATFKSRAGNLNKITRNKARMAQYTYIIAPDADKAKWSGKTITPEKVAPLIEKQRRFVEEKRELIQIDGYLGVGGKAFPVQWFYTKEAANVAGMQQILAFPRSAVETPEQLKRPFQPTFRLVYTPDFPADGLPSNQAILVDLNSMTTYLMGVDYFGESKKGALRMLNEYVYREGGLVMHAGAKSVQIGGREMTMVILGLSGTGKTTTTFSKQGELTRPIQDDMVCLWRGGVCTVTENGCFAKTYSLTRESEPVIYDGTMSADAWVENAFMNPDGSYDFFKGLLTQDEVAKWRDVLVKTGAVAANVDAYIQRKVAAKEVVDDRGITKDGWDFLVWTQNGRSIIPMSAVKDAADLRRLPPVMSIGILNRDEGPDAATPGIVRFTTPEQAAGYFMLGETSKTSAAGKERGKTRSPFTQPFFPGSEGLQAKRFSELSATLPQGTMWMMNTGYVGGDSFDVERGKALKVKISHSNAMLEAMLGNKVKWARDPDFGYEVADVNAPENATLVAQVPKEVLQPKLFYDKAGRGGEYAKWVAQMKRERKAFLEKYAVGAEIVRAVVG